MLLLRFPQDMRLFECNKITSDEPSSNMTTRPIVGTLNTNGNITRRTKKEVLLDITLDIVHHTQTLTIMFL